MVMQLERMSGSRPLIRLSGRLDGSWILPISFVSSSYCGPCWLIIGRILIMKVDSAVMFSMEQRVSYDCADKS